MKPPNKPEHVLQVVKKTPWQAYKLADDKREQRSLCKQRRELTNQYAFYADDDGTNIRPSIGTVAKDIGESRQTIWRLNADLEKLNIIHKHGRYQGDGPWILSLDLPVLKELTVTANRCSKLPVPNSEIVVPNSEIVVPNSEDRCSKLPENSGSLEHNLPVPPEKEPPEVNLPFPTSPKKEVDRTGVDSTPSSGEEATKAEKKQLRDRWNALVEKLDPEIGLVSDDGGTNVIYLRGVQPTFKQREEIFKQVDLVGPESWRVAVEAWACQDKIYGLDAPWWAWLEPTRGGKFFIEILPSALQYRERDVFRLLGKRYKQIVNRVRQQLFPGDHITVMEKLQVLLHIKENADSLLKQGEQ